MVAVVKPVKGDGGSLLKCNLWQTLLVCETCNGKRFKSTLEVNFEEKNIDDISKPDH
jgi:excinuclease UvrABC ATPase subunit